MNRVISVVLLNLVFSVWNFAQWVPSMIEGPVYPAIATQAQLSGTVRLSVSISSQGRVSKTHVVSGNPVLARAAEENIRRWRFLAVCAPHGTAPEETVEFTFDFQIRGDPQSRPRTQFKYEHPYRVAVIGEPQLMNPAEGRRRQTHHGSGETRTSPGPTHEFR